MKIIRKYLGPPKVILFIVVMAISSAAMIHKSKNRDKEPCKLTAKEIYYIESDALEIIDIIETHKPLDSSDIEIILERTKLILETVK